MDLLKMDPMARKMEEHQKAFLSALTSGNANLAKQHLNEVRKVADYLSEDISAAIAKAESGLTAVYSCHRYIWSLFKLRCYYG